jgi:phage terminase large subunit
VRARSAEQHQGFGQAIDRGQNNTLQAVDVDTGKRWPIAPWFKITDREIVCPHTDSLAIFRGLQNHTAASIKSLEGFTRAWYEESHSLTQRSLDLATPTFRAPGSQQRFSWNPDLETDPVDVFFNSAVAENDPDFTGHGQLRRQSVVSRRTAPGHGTRQARDFDKYLWVWRGGYRKNSAAQVFKNIKVEPFDPPKFGTPLWAAPIGAFRSTRPSGWFAWIEGRTLYIWREVYLVGCEIDRTPRCSTNSTRIGRRPTPRIRIGNHRAQMDFIADSARPETISYMQRAGFRIQPAIKGTGSVEDGISFLQSYDIVIHPTACVHAATEFKLYSFKIDKKTNAITTELDEKDNHTIDSARYAVETCVAPSPPRAGSCSNDHQGRIDADSRSGGHGRGRAPVRTLVGGTKAMRAAGEEYLPREPMESQAATRSRKKRSTLFNATKQDGQGHDRQGVAKPIVTDKVTDADIKGVVREYRQRRPAHLNVFAKDVFYDDAAGNRFHFRGHAAAVKREDGQPATIADEQKAGIRPYLKNIPLENLIGWKSAVVAGKEVLTQIRIKECATEPDPENPWQDKDVDQIRVITRDGTVSAPGRRSAKGKGRQKRNGCSTRTAQATCRKFRCSRSTSNAPISCRRRRRSPSWRN